jgi:probable lipoprotein NlpC
VARVLRLALPLALLAACAGPGWSGPPRPDLSSYGLRARLAARAASLVGHTQTFQVGSETFRADCSGFVEAVYAAEGIPLRRLAAQAAPAETSGVAALHHAARTNGLVFGGGGEWPAPGDLVFFHDTYDRNRDGRADDPFTHIGIVEYVSRDGTVVFVHRAGTGVARGALTTDRPELAKDAGGTLRNSAMRDKRPPVRAGEVLAGQLFAGYGRIATSR